MANETALADHLRTTTRRRHCMAAAARLLPDPIKPVVYFVGGPYGHIKIGYAANLRARIAELQTGNPAPLMAYAYWCGPMADERAAHRHFAADRGHGEWFVRSPKLIRTIMSLQAAIAKGAGIVLSRDAPATNEWADLEELATPSTTGPANA